MFQETQSVMGSSVEKQGPLAEVETEEWADMDVKKEMFLESAPTVSPAEDHHQERGVSLASADRRSSRQSVQRTFSSVTTVPTEYHFTESVWSASAWIGQAPVVESCILSTVLLVNILVQLYFSVLVIGNMGSYSDVSLADDDLEGFLAWRTGTAHHMAHYDETTNTSLATRVCDSYPGTITAFDQMQQITTFGLYTGDGSTYDLALAGPGLAMLSVMCWISWVATDVLDNLDFSIALLSNSARETVIETSADWSSCTIVSFSRFAVGGLHIFVVLPRLIIACTLFYAGSRFLLFTSSLGDLLLNAIALGFILDMDELLFAFLPQTVRSALLAATGLCLRLPGNRNVHWRPLLLVVVALAGCSATSLCSLTSFSDAVGARHIVWWLHTCRVRRGRFHAGGSRGRRALMCHPSSTIPTSSTLSCSSLT